MHMELMQTMVGLLGWTASLDRRYPTLREPRWVREMSIVDESMVLIRCK